MQKLTALFGANLQLPDIELTDMTLDSRSVKTGCLFVAIKGHQTDGRQYIAQAIKQGASAVIFDADSAQQHLQVHVEQGIPCIAYFQLSSHLSALAF